MDSPATSTATCEPLMPTLAQQYARLQRWVNPMGRTSPAEYAGRPIHVGQLHLELPEEDLVPSPELERDEVEVLRVVLPGEVSFRNGLPALTRTLRFYLDVLGQADPGLSTMAFRLSSAGMVLRDGGLEPGIQRIALRPYAVQTQQPPFLGEAIDQVEGTKYSLAGIEALAFLAFCWPVLAGMTAGQVPSMSLPGLKSLDPDDDPEQLMPAIYPRSRPKLRENSDGVKKQTLVRSLFMCPRVYLPDEGLMWSIPTYRNLGPVRPFEYMKN